MVSTQHITENFLVQSIDNLPCVSDVMEARICCPLTKQRRSFGINNPGSQRITQSAVNLAPGNRNRNSAPLRTRRHTENQARNYPEENRRPQHHSLSRSPTTPRCRTRDFFPLRPNSPQSNHDIFRTPRSTHTNIPLDRKSVV